MGDGAGVRRLVARAEMGTTRAVRLTSGDGPLGTGVFLLRLHALPGGLQGQAWLLLGFFPVAPHGRVRLAERLAAEGGGEGRLYEEEGSGQLTPGEAAATYARAVAGLVLVLACLTMAYLCVAESSWLGGLGVLLGGALPLALFGWLDQTMRRRRVVSAKL